MASRAARCPPTCWSVSRSVSQSAERCLLGGGDAEDGQRDSALSPSCRCRLATANTARRPRGLLSLSSWPSLFVFVQVERAKVLSNTIKQKRKEKAGKWEVPLPKVSGARPGGKGRLG